MASAERLQLRQQHAKPALAELHFWLARNGRWPPAAAREKSSSMRSNAGRRCCAAPIQTLLGTAKLHGLDPLHWLASVLESLLTCPNNQIDSLLPFLNFTQL